MTWSALLQLRPDAPPLRSVQERALDALVAADSGPWGPRGLFGDIGCGHGKTLVAQLAPMVTGAARPLLILPAARVPQTEADVRWWGRFYPMGIPDRGSWVTYEALQVPQGADRLARFNPDLLVLDEAHLVGNPTSARWRRIARFVSGHPGCRVVALSGTMASTGVGQMAHLLHATLRDRSPLPSDPELLRHLAAVVDVGGEPIEDDYRAAASVAPARGMGTRREMHRLGLQEKIHGTPGVVWAPGVAADVSLSISVVKPPPPPDSIRDAVQALRDRWVLPDGTELVEALELHRHLRTLVWGYFLRWIPGTVDPAWLKARRRWHTEIRRLLAYDPALAVAGIDSPAMVEDAARRGHLDGRAMAAWKVWAVDGGAMAYSLWPEPPSEAVWLEGGYSYTTSLVEHLPMTKEGQGTVFWCSSPTVGGSLGLPWFGAGSAPPVVPGGSVAMSWRVHGEGWNGQEWGRAVVLEPPDGPRAWEQLLARHHRPGAAGDVSVVVVCAAPEIERSLLSDVQAARFARDTLGTPQRLLLASWDWPDAWDFRHP